MDDKGLLFELNRILTLEHGHLGMYENFRNHADKELQRTFRRFMEIEVEHIEKIKSVIYNMGGKPSLVVEGGDIMGKFFGVTVNLADTGGMLKSYSFIENKSHQGYAEFVAKLERDGEKRSQFIAEITAANMLEAQMMYLWLEDKIKRM